MKKLRKSLALFMVLCMMTSMLSTSVFAAEETEAEKLQAKINAAEDGVETTITMTADAENISKAISVPEGKNIVLDMAGHKITVSGDFSGRAIENAGTLKVQGNGTIDASDGKDGYGAINNTGTLTIENGTFRGNSESRASNIRNYGKDAVLVINNGTFDTSTTAVLNYDGTATLNGGTYTTHDHNCSACGNNWAYVVRTYTDKKEGIYPRLYVNGGTYIGTQGAMSSSTGYIEVNGGTFKTEPCRNRQKHNSIFYALYAAGEYGKVQCVINGGTFETVGPYAAVLVGNDNKNGDGGINADAIANVYGGEFIAPKGVSALNVAQYTAKASILHGGTYSLLTENAAKYIDPAVVGEAGTNVVLTPRTAEGSVAQIGEGENAKYYVSLQDAINACPVDGTETTIEMRQDYEVPESVEKVTVNGGRNIVLDLKGHTVSHNKKYLFWVSNARFHVTGKGTLLENIIDGYAPIIAKGAATDKGENYTVVTVDKDVVLKGDYAGIFTATDDSGKTYKNYGLVVNMYGTVDLNVEGGKENYGSGIYINGSNKNTEGNVPVYNLDGARVLEGSGTGIYAAGYAKWNLKDVTMTAGNALSLKAGTFVIDGGSYTSTGAYANPSTDTSNGSVDTGAALSMTSNDGYAKKLDVTVNGGIFESKNGNAVYEGIPNKTGTETPVAGESYVTLKINGGTFKSAEGKDAVDLTKIKDKSVISGGVFSTDVTKYCAEGLMAVKDDSGNYVIDNVQALPDEVVVETHKTEGKTVTSVGGSIAEGDIETAKKIAENVTPANLADATEPEAQDSEKADAVNKLHANGLIEIDNNGAITAPDSKDKVTITVVHETYLDVTITDLQNADTEKSITLEIEPKYNLLATTGDPTLSEDEEGVMTDDNTVTLATGKDLTVKEGTTVDISIALPEGFADEGTTLYVKHVKDDGRTYVYSAVVDSKTLTFSNPHGFSTFTITDTDDTVAKIGDACYTSFQDAVDAAQNNETVEVIKNAELTADMSSVTKTITVKNNTEAEITVTVNDKDYTIAVGETQEVSYIKPIIDDGGSSYSPSYGITVDKTENGSVFADAQSAVKGTAVTVTVKPAEGYELSTLTVTDKDGNKVSVTNKDGKYTFTMPDSKVTVKAVFKEIKAASNPFNDVNENAWYYDDIMYVYNKGVMTGTADDMFSPYATTTRGTIATILYRLEGEPNVSGASSFDDVADGSWYADAIKWAADNKIVDGYGDGRFGPDDVITREQMAVILYRYASFKGIDMTKSADLSKFSDYDKVSVWSKDALSWANAEKIINGKGDGILDPMGNATRAEIAAILHGFCENVAK